jgi:hypothetical protein
VEGGFVDVNARRKVQFVYRRRLVVFKIAVVFTCSTVIESKRTAGDCSLQELRLLQCAVHRRSTISYGFGL